MEAATFPEWIHSDRLRFEHTGRRLKPAATENQYLTLRQGGIIDSEESIKKYETFKLSQLTHPS